MYTYLVGHIYSCLMLETLSYNLSLKKEPSRDYLHHFNAAGWPDIK